MSPQYKRQFSFILLAIALAAGTPLNANSQPTQLIPIPENAATHPGVETRNFASLKQRNPSPTTEINWQTILGPTPAPARWKALPCDLPIFLCVSENKKQVGTVELLVFPLDSLPDFQRMLTEAGIPPGSVNYQSPKYKAQVLTALRAWVAEYYAFFEENRKPEYGDQVTFSPRTPEEITVGKLPGLRYGFSGIEQGGSVREQQLGHVAFDGSRLYVIATAFDPAAETTKFDTVESLRRFEPYLLKIVSGLRLPVANK
ncbi:MAG: hypothetical protein KME08_15655 [Aphanothece sp. CMT-3BRIN-NPC111]|jgi:hypothetical protein|nr:hypothetical protein [Aphanothece sp. CMT-3BRIN-NPC111]